MATTTRKLLRFADGFGIWRYVSMFGARASHDYDSAREAQRVYNFKKYGYLKAEIKATVEAAASALGCDAIVACPSHTTEPNRLQEMFGSVLTRTKEVDSRKYKHEAEIDFDAEIATLEIKDGFSAKKVLIVDDVTTTGKTLRFYRLLFKSLGIESELFALGVYRNLNPTEDGPEVTVSVAEPEAQSGAERKARFVARRADIGPVPPPVDPERRARAEASLVAFCESYCMAGDGSFGLFDHAPSDRIREYIEDTQKRIETTGRVHVSFPRGGGKTTVAKAAALWGIVFGKVRFAVLFAASAPLAQAVLDDIWGIMAGNVAFGEDFPEIRLPIDRGGDVAQRMRVLTHNGKRLGIQHTGNLIAFPEIEDEDGNPYPCSGARFKAFGAGAAARGIARGATRPDLILLDDLQKDSDARSQTRVEALEKWVSGAVQGLAGKRRVSVIMTSTPIAPEDLSARFMDETLHPEWMRIRYPLLDPPPSNEELWEEYDRLAREDEAHGEPTYPTATAFYGKHRKEMDAGAVVLDPLNFDARNELSAIQHARNLRLGMGETAFRAEYLLDVRPDNAVLDLSRSVVASKVNGCERYALPPGTSRTVAFIDVNSSIGLSYAVVAFGRGQVGAVIDYGRVPGNGQRLTPVNATERQIQSKVASALYDLVSRLLKQTYRDRKGKAVPLGSVWIDSGYLQDVVLRVAWLVRKRTGADCHGVKGYSAAWYNPNAKTVVARADGVDFRQGPDGSQWFGRNADTSKETMQRAFLGLPLQSGTLSLWGSDPRFHWEFAGEVCAERLTDKATSARGVDLYRWSITGPNHWGDCLAGCISCAIWHRWWDATDVVPKAVPKRSRVKASAVPLRPIRRKAPAARKRRIRSARPVI